LKCVYNRPVIYLMELWYVVYTVITEMTISMSYICWDQRKVKHRLLCVIYW